MLHRSRLGSLGLLILLLMPYAFVGSMTTQPLEQAEEFTPSQTGWLAGWQYRKSHTITGSVGAGTNYQVRVTVHRTTGSDSGANVYVGSNCKSDFGDIRFTDDDGVTVLDYWIQESTTENASIWVEVIDSLDIDVDIYLYYGNPSADTASNGSNTFIAFDDFEDYTSGATPSADNGWTNIDDVYIQTNPGERSGMGLKLDTAISSNSEGLENDWGTNDHDSIAIHYMWYCSRVVDRNGYTTILGYQASTIAAAVTTLWDGQFSPINREWFSGSSYSVFSPSFTYSSGLWYEIEDCVSSDYYHSFQDGVDLTGGTRNSGVDNFDRFTISTYQDNRHGDWFTQYDDFFVRKWIESEPSHSTWGISSTTTMTTSTSTTDSTTTIPQTTQPPPPVFDTMLIVILGIGGGGIALIAIIVIFLKRTPKGETVPSSYEW